MGQEHLIAIGISVGLSAVVAFYKGEDFLDWENAEAPWVENWDDEKVHTEGEIG